MALDYCPLTSSSEDIVPEDIDTKKTEKKKGFHLPNPVKEVKELVKGMKENPEETAKNSLEGAMKVSAAFTVGWGLLYVIMSRAGANVDPTTLQEGAKIAAEFGAVKSLLSLGVESGLWVAAKNQVFSKFPHGHKNTDVDEIPEKEEQQLETNPIEVDNLEED